MSTSANDDMTINAATITATPFLLFAISLPLLKMIWPDMDVNVLIYCFFTSGKIKDILTFLSGTKMLCQTVLRLWPKYPLQRSADVHTFVLLTL